MLGFYGLFDRAVPYRLGTLHGTPYGLSLPPAGAVFFGCRIITPVTEKLLFDSNP